MYHSNDQRDLIPCCRQLRHNKQSLYLYKILGMLCMVAMDPSPFVGHIFQIKYSLSYIINYDFPIELKGRLVLHTVW